MVRSLIHKRHLLAAASCGLVSALAPGLQAAAQDGAAVQVAQAGSTTAPTVSDRTETIVVRAKKRLLREKDSPSAVTELGEKAISQVGASGSVATLLRQAPSVNVYQQGLGNNEPVLSIRGLRGLETAQTLDDVPVQDLLNGGTGSFLQNIIGGRFNLDQISGVEIYPGVAYPNKNTFGTIGGTIAYQTRRPEKDAYFDVIGGIGSFGQYNEGFVANTGRLDGVFGTGDNAPSVLLQYSNQQNNGFVDYTPAKYNNIEFAVDKPYMDGLSKFQFTALFNTGNGLFTPEPIPVPYQNQNGAFSNFPTSAEFTRETNQYATFILKNDTYVNDYLGVGVTLFYENSDSTLLAYGNASEFTPPYAPGTPPFINNPYAINGAAPFIQVPAGFGQQGLYGPGNLFYDPQVYTYDGNKSYPAGSAACPAKLSAAWAAAGLASPCGYNAQLQVTHNDTYGIQPRLLITPPEFFGINNAIQIGGIIAKETEPTTPTYAGGTPNVPQNAQNLIGGFDGGVQRTIYQLYAQDKIELLDNTLHLTPGITVEATNSSYRESKVFGGTPSAALLASAYCQAGNTCLNGSFQARKYDKVYLPFFNVTYDLDRLAPMLKNFSVYGSTGNSALFAPVTDFSPNLVGQPPYASIVHLYEGGVKYNAPNLVAGINYFYQKVDRDFGFFQFQSGPQAGQSLYTNNGQREFKGFEASATYQLSPQWQLFGNASHILAKYLQTSLGNVTVQQDQFGVVQRGTPNTGVPDWLSTFGVEYSRHGTLRDGDAFDARFEGQYTGKQQTSFDVNGFQNIGPIRGVTPFGPPNLNSSYQYYNVTAGATTFDPNGGISPFAIFNLDLNYTLPTPGIPLKQVKFDLNVLNLFNQRYFQYFYKQISPTNCPAFTDGTFGSSKVKGVGGLGPISQSNYGCTPSFSDGIPGQPFTVVFTMTARF